MYKKMMKWLTRRCEMAKKQNEYFTGVGDLRTAMYWKGLWVAYQAVLLEAGKEKEGFSEWKPRK